MADEGSALMDTDTHAIIHLLSELQKEEIIQRDSFRRKEKILDKIGSILDRQIAEMADGR